MEEYSKEQVVQEIIIHSDRLVKIAKHIQDSKNPMPATVYEGAWMTKKLAAMEFAAIGRQLCELTDMSPQRLANFIFESSNSGERDQPQPGFRDEKL